MSETYGLMVGCDTAIKWIEELPESDMRNRVLSRMRYEFDKDNPVKPKYHKGRNGRRYDSYSCGNCGAGITEAHWTYCPNCGFRIGRKYESWVS